MNINDLQKDALKEYGSICAGNASSSLSQIFGRDIKIRTFDTVIVPHKEVVQAMGGPQIDITSIEFRVFGDASGKIIITFDRESTDYFKAILNDALSSARDIPENESSIKETGNIIAGAYINAVTSMLQKRIILSMPIILKDVVETILENNINSIEEFSNNILMMDITYIESEISMKGKFIIFPDQAMLNILLDVNSVKEI
jgi:chemotaxis protein CheC